MFNIKKEVRKYVLMILDIDSLEVHILEYYLI
jgi:hypothetical protein